MFNKGFNAVFMTRPFWAEMNVPQSIVFKIYKEYLGTASMIIASRTESIEYISPVVNRFVSMRFPRFQMNIQSFKINHNT